MKYALVTGASSGIGEAIAKALARAHDGLFILLVGRKEAELQRVLDEVGGAARGAYITAELTNTDDLARLRTEVLSHTQTLDILVQAAGMFAWDDEFAGSAPESIAKHRAVNFTSKTMLWDAVGDLLRASTGTMLVVSSQAAKFADDDPRRVNELGYGDSMREVSAWAHRLAGAHTNFRLVLLEPGLIDTPLARRGFTVERIGRAIDWDHDAEVLKPEQLAQQALELIEAAQRIPT